MLDAELQLVATMVSDSVPEPHLDRARAIALTFPDATERETWGHPTFRVRDKIFTGIGVSDEVTTMSMKAAPGEQASLLATGHPFFKPPYVGNRGWIGIVIDADTDWDEVAELIEDSYRAIAPKTLVRQLDTD